MEVVSEAIQRYAVANMLAIVIGLIERVEGGFRVTRQQITMVIRGAAGKRLHYQAPRQAENA
jgi:hypothetical protein